MRLLVAGLLVLASSAASAADQFDLICKGTSGQGSEQKLYRVDLKTGRWCSTECTVQSIARLERGIIWFREDRPKFPGDGQWLEYVDRVSGKWVRAMGAYITEGTCEPAPFSGIGQKPTKF